MIAGNTKVDADDDEFGADIKIVFQQQSAPQNAADSGFHVAGNLRM